MLQWPGEILFASFLGIIILISIILIQQPDPPRYQDQPRRTPSPSPPPSPILNTINTPYNETEIASLLTELYELLVKLAYIPHEAVTWPPESGHEINEELCTQLGMDAAVISLMKRIPYVNSDEGYGLHLFPRSEADSFLRDDDILESRDPENFSTELRLYYILPHDIALSHNMCDGMTLVLDTKANTVRLCDNNYGLGYVNPESFVQERPEEPLYYRNYYTQDATSYFRRLNEKIRTLKLIPSPRTNFDREYHGDEDHHVRDEVKKILIEKYGWQENFRLDNWARDAEEIWQDAIKRSLD